MNIMIIKSAMINCPAIWIIFNIKLYFDLVQNVRKLAITNWSPNNFILWMWNPKLILIGMELNGIR